jgi:uncharacterized OsmC-like protein
MTQSDVRQYEDKANSTETFGLVLCSARNHHFVTDGPAQSGCPVEALTPAELFLSGVAACGVELMQAIARDKHLPWQTAGIAITGTIDPENRVHSDFRVFTSVRLQFVLRVINASLWRDQILIPGGVRWEIRSALLSEALSAKILRTGPRSGSQQRCCLHSSGYR